MSLNIKTCGAEKMGLDIIAPLETNPTQTPYNATDLLVCDDSLFQAITSINIGDALVEGGNIKKTSVADALGTSQYTRTERLVSFFRRNNTAFASRALSNLSLTIHGTASTTWVFVEAVPEWCLPASTLYFIGHAWIETGYSVIPVYLCLDKIEKDIKIKAVTTSGDITIRALTFCVAYPVV